MEKVICKSCGCENGSNEIFCKECGKMIMTSEYTENKDLPQKEKPEDKTIKEKNSKTPNNKKRNIIIISIVAVVLVVGIVIGIFAIVGSKGSNGHSQAPTEEAILSDLNNDKSVTTVKINGKDTDFKVSAVKINSAEEAVQEEAKHYVVELEVTRKNKQYKIKPIPYTVMYAISKGKYSYTTATPADGTKVTLEPLCGIDVELAKKKVNKEYSDAKFDKQETDLKKGIDKIWFKINNKTNKGSICSVYKFHEQKGWLFDKIDDKNLSFKPGVTHQQDGLYTNTAVKNVMFFGVDAEGYAGRSDCMMLVSIDTNTSKIKLTSFMRDTYVNIPGYGGNKLNSAFAMGGPELAVSAIEATYGVKIDNYAATNFTTFKSVINSLGGVNVNITADEAGYINWQLNHNGQASIGFVPSSGGNVTLNGQQALWLCRDRGGNGFSGDDFVRTSRQRRVIKSLISSYKSYSSSQVLSTLNNLIGNVSTDLSGDDLQWLAENSGKFFDFEIKERCAPDAGEWSQGYSSAGAWIIQVNDWGNLKSSIQKFIYEDLK